MIRVNVGLALKITDGYTGEAVDGGGLLFSVDGVCRRAVAKKGGFYAFSEISPGRHELKIESNSYLPETMSFTAGQGLIPVDLKPGDRYVYGPGSRVTEIFNPSDTDIEILTGHKDPVREIRIAQSGLSAGDTAVRLFFDAETAPMSFPRRMLILDGEDSETVIVEGLEEDGESPLSEGMVSAHKRGCLLYPVQNYTIGPSGSIAVHFPEGTDLFIFIPKTGKLIESAAGTDSITI